MKVAYIDVELSGHHIKYLTTLFQANSDTIAILPRKICQMPDDRQFVVENTNQLFKHPILYFWWLHRVYKIVKREKVDIVHFLYGDVMVRYFGVGVSKFKKYKRIVTFHQIRRHWLKDISFCRLCKKMDVVIVHTKKLENDLHRMGIKNVEQIEYPCFLGNFCENTKQQVCKELGIQNDVPILLLIGILARYKGLDTLVNALSSVRGKYHLIVAGYNQEYFDDELLSFKEKLKSHITFDLHYLSEKEYAKYLSAADFVLLPYSKRFDGASGPLTDAVLFKKTVIASNHASLGKIIRENSLGVLFETGNAEELKTAIERALKSEIQWNVKAEKYRNNIVNLDGFIAANQEVYRKQMTAK